MKTKDFAFVGAKIVGIVLFINGIKWIVSAIEMWLISSSDVSNISSSLAIFHLFSAIVVLGMSLFLWGFTGKILTFFLPEDKNNHENSVDKENVEPHGLQIAAFTVVGLVILSDAIPKIFYGAAEILANKDSYFPMFSDGGVNPRSLQLFAKSLGHLVYLFIGIYLVFGFKNLISIIGKWFSKLRRDIDTGDGNGENAGNKVSGK